MRLAGLTSDGGPWVGQCRVLRLQAMDDGGLGIYVELRVPGLVWDGQQPLRHDEGFTLVLIVPSHYPHVKPDVRLLQPVAFAPHVLHPSCSIQEADLPQELLEYVERLRQHEAGCCCYIRSHAWLATVDYDLALCLYLVSGVITGARRWGERGTLNPLALEWFDRERVRLPLGDPLPFPQGDLSENAGVRAVDDEDEDPMAWNEADAGGLV